MSILDYRPGGMRRRQATATWTPLDKRGRPSGPTVPLRVPPTKRRRSADGKHPLARLAQSRGPR